MIQRTILLLAVCLVAAGTASAGGAYLPRTGTAESISQRAILVLEGNTTTLLMQSGFSGSSDDLAWLVPVTGVGAAQAIDLGTSDAFERLHEESAPQMVRLVEKRGSLGCSSEGVTFVTPTTIQPFNGLSATSTSFFALDAQLSDNVHDWLGGASLGAVCPDLATSCDEDEDCGQATVCQGGFCRNQVFDCATDADCNADIECFQFMCVNLTRTCTNDVQCGGVVSCRDEACLRLTPTCVDDTDCGGEIEADLCELRLCTDDTTPCDEDLDCPTDETCQLLCPDGTPCAGDADCEFLVECKQDTCGDGRACSNEVDCRDVAECDAGRCTDNSVCVTDEDCGGVTECTGHCMDEKVDCTDDADCDMLCRDNLCKDPVSFADPRVTEKYCDEDADCEAIAECQAFSIQGTETELCTNLAPPCSNGFHCDVTCEEYPPGEGQSYCGGDFSRISCTDNSPCTATIECQQAICVNLTPTCTTDTQCSTTCDNGFCGGSDVPCSGAADCTASPECRARNAGTPYPVTDEQSAWLDANDGSKFAVAKLSGVTSATGEDLMPPLMIQLGGDQPTFPLRMVSGSPTVDLELYVIAHERMRPANYASAQVVIDEFFDGGDFDAWYAERLEKNLTEPTVPTFMLEYADVIDLSVVDHVLGRPASVAQLGANQWFLTKYRARLAPEDAPSDLTLSSTGSERFVIRAVSNGPAAEAGLPFGLLVVGALWIAWRVRRRA